MSKGSGLAHFHGVILAGGRGTRFWPRSRKDLPKQLLNIVSDRSMLEQTVERLRPLIPPERLWVLTNERLKQRIVRKLPEVPRRQIIAEPVQRNTGPAIALAAHLLYEQDPDAVMGVFPADHVINDSATFLKVLRGGVKAAGQGKLVVLGIKPLWPETGYGYIEFPPTRGGRVLQPRRVVGFREKPRLKLAKAYCSAGNFYWNSGIFLWRAATILASVKAHMPKTARAVAQLPSHESRRFTAALRKWYPRCEKVSIDYGVLEKAGDALAGIACGDIGWNDVGGWEAVYNLLPKDALENVSRSPLLADRASGNLVDAPGKLTALVGVKDLVVVDTPDALLICRRRDAQKISALVEALESGGFGSLL